MTVTVEQKKEPSSTLYTGTNKVNFGLRMEMAMQKLKVSVNDNHVATESTSLTVQYEVQHFVPNAFTLCLYLPNYRFGDHCARSDETDRLKVF